MLHAESELVRRLERRSIRDRCRIEDREIGEHTFANEAAAVARNALLTLTTEQREVLVLKFYLNLETSEIAKIMGKRQGTIRGLQLRALRALRRQLGDE